jgi:hypothetical protein
LYQGASIAALKLQTTIYWQPALPIAVAEPPTATQQDNWVAIRWAQALCAAVAWDRHCDRATPAAFVQGRHRDICGTAACGFVRKFQVITLGYKVIPFCFCYHFLLVISRLQEVVGKSGV